jgi:peptide chain release factor subunit 1
MVTERVTHFYGCQIATSNSVKQHKLRKLVSSLSDKEGRGREFVSLYIPRKVSIEDVVATLKNETGSASAKSDTVSDHLQDALKNSIQHLRMYKELPENGLAIFAGTFPANNQEVSTVEEIISPRAITTYLYEANDHFQLEPLREMLRDQKVIGLLFMDAKEASFGVLNGERLEFIENITSGVPGKSSKGGQSQRRYEKERDMELTNYFHRVAEHATKAFLERHRITALIVGGPGQTKNDFAKGDYLHYELQNALLSIVDTQFSGKEGVREVLEKSSETIKNMCGPEERHVMQRFLTELNKQNGLAICGLDAVMNGLKKGEVEVALATDTSDLVEVVATCKKCGLSKMEIMGKRQIYAIQEFISRPCQRCNAVEHEVDEKDIIDVLEDAASQTNATVEVISTDSEEKAKLTALGSFAAILRYISG